MLKFLTQHPYWQWLPVALVLAVASAWLGRRLWVRTTGTRRTGTLVDYRASQGRNGTSWAAIIEWHDDEGVARTFVDDVALASQPWPIGTRMDLAVAADRRTIVVIGPASPD